VITDGAARPIAGHRERLRRAPGQAAPPPRRRWGQRPRLDTGYPARRVCV